MNKTTAPISEQQAAQLLHKHYAIEGSIKPLPGEVDCNFKVTDSSEVSYVLKITEDLSSIDYLEFQQSLLSYLDSSKGTLETPRVIHDLEGNTIVKHQDDKKKTYYLRLLSWMPGRVWNSVNPHSKALRFSLGAYCGQLTHCLQGFEHPLAQRSFKWDVAQSLWTKDKLELFTSTQAKLASYFIDLFESEKDNYDQLRKSVVHNDANDFNILISEDLMNPKVTALIDFGDAIYTQVINDLGICCAYAIMNQQDPLEAALPIVEGYHHSFPLQEEELEHLYSIIGMRLVISVTQSAINKKQHPENNYLQISEQPAWDLLHKWQAIDKELAHYSFRHCCGYSPHPQESAFNSFAQQNSYSVMDLFPTIQGAELKHLDLSVSSKWIGHAQEYNDLDVFQFKLEQLQKKEPEKILAGGYLEARSLYGTSSYNKIGNHGPETRSIHLGVDFWLPAYTPVHALFDGEVVTAVNDAGNKEYGGLLILKHQIGELCFYSLYGHNTVASVIKHKPGDQVKKGDQLSELGDYPENGNWAPHLHFQLMLSMLDFKTDFPGVMYPNQIEVWKSLCPDPNALFKSKALTPKSDASNQELINFRQEHLGKSLSLHYQEPIKIVRGQGAYLIDEKGRYYLDTVNNVAHVGHEHYPVYKAGADQMALLNTNTRYLHENINALAEELLETLPEELSVVHLVNSGSEANELALRMAKTYTEQQDIIASQYGYHGNTNACVAISSYKFDGKGGTGAPAHTHIFPLPDTLRGRYRGTTAVNDYADEVNQCIKRINKQGRAPAALIVEPIISCGGQIELPKGFLKQAYEHIRAAGGLCISDEVQVGCGRMGTSFWGFEQHGVIPDIVTIGKPLGNGHPVAAVVCTQKVADSFANGMEYFNTFGGNPVSCAIATEVLRTIKRDQLQKNALKVGTYLKEELLKLSKEHAIIADVRGQGLFLGFELLDQEMKPLPIQTNYLINRMKEYGILMSSDGPDVNVIKIKPPIVFNQSQADELLYYLKLVFSEDVMREFY